MSGYRSLTLGAVILLGAGAPVLAGETSPCTPNVRKASARLQCLAHIVAGLRTDIDELKQAASQRDAALPATRDKVHDLEQRLYVLEQNDAQKIRLGLTMPFSVGSRFERNDNRSAGSSLPAKGFDKHASVIYSGTPLLTLSNPGSLNGVVGVRGKADTQSGEAQGPQN